MARCSQEVSKPRKLLGCRLLGPIGETGKYECSVTRGVERHGQRMPMTRNLPRSSIGSFQDKVDFALGHLDQIFPIRKSRITNYVARFNNGTQSSNTSFRESGDSFRGLSEYFVRSQHLPMHRHAV